jgi:ATP-dependent Lhr-like helicase
MIIVIGGVNLKYEASRGWETSPTGYDKMTGEEIKTRLPRTWVPFFSRFGQFLPIQEMTIPHILEGRNVVVISPSASGKTEAVIAPVIENTITASGDDTSPALRILYISPTRALVNDLYRRLVDPIEYTGLTIGRKTGDLPQPNIKKMPSVLLTTPESFDSLVTRHPKVFMSLQRVILDEIHLLDNTPRGDQLRVLLNRLRRIRDRLQYCALSATIDDLTIGSRYFDDPHVCMLETPREVGFELIGSKHFIEKLFSTARERGFKKILVFFNARSLTEVFSQELNRPPFQDAVFVHHASLEKSRREAVEQQMIRSEHAILCATSTLELGIDIGDIDCVVLYRPPFNISSLLQRIGRGNRRTTRLYAMGVYTSRWEEVLFHTFIDNARAGRLFEKKYKPSLSVIPQQIYSYLFQRRRIGSTLQSLYRVMEPVYTQDQVKTVFKELLDNGALKQGRPGIYYNSPKLEKKIDYGKIHSNIAEVAFGEYDVFDTGTGQGIGRIFHLKQQFILGGRCWEIERIDDLNKRVYAVFRGNAPAMAKVFEGKGDGNYSFLLAPVIKSRLFPDLDPLVFPYARDGRSIYIVHFLGDLYGSLLADSLDHEGVDALDLDAKILILNRYEVTNEQCPCPDSGTFRHIISKNIARFEDALGSGAYLYDLPKHYQIEDHYLNLDIDGFLEYLRSIRLQEISLPDFRRAVQKLK